MCIRDSAETGQFGDVGMNSFNHYSYGSVGEWFYNYVGGIKADEKEPGYKHFTCLLYTSCPNAPKWWLRR